MGVKIAFVQIEVIVELEKWSVKVHELMLAVGFEVSTITEVDSYQIEGFVKRGKRADAPVIYLSSGVHGDEPAGPLAIESLVELGAFSDHFTWIVCPMMNPTGHALGTRQNKAGIDLNRDYFFKKSREVQGHIEWLEKLPVPDLMLSLHEDWESSGYYFYEINIREDYPERAHSLMQELDQVMLREPDLVIDDHDVREAGWIYHEAFADEFQCWPEAIYMAKRGCPISLTMESPSSLVLEQRIAVLVAFVKTAVKVWL